MAQKSLVLDLDCDVRVVPAQPKALQAHEERIDVIFPHIQLA